MAQQAGGHRVWPWILVALGILVVGGLCTFTTIIAVLISRPEGGFGGGDAVAVVRIEGTLSEGEEGTDLFGGGSAFSRPIIDQIKRGRHDSSVRAIVLRINSPGGGVVASDDIYREVLRARQDGKKVVVSMGTLAASGGYYISAGADRIVASPATQTGSIGVISMIPNAQELMNKIGVQMTVIKSGTLKDEGSPFRPMTEEEKANFQSMVNQLYDQFVEIVAKGRNMDVQEVRNLADGRTYLGTRAMELGLVDELGDLPYAIDLAAKMGGISGKPRIVEYRRPSFVESLFGSLARGLPQFSFSPVKTLGVEARPSLQYLYVQ